MNKEEIINFMISGESEKIRTAGLEIIRNSQNEDFISELIPYVKEITKSTYNLDLGGAFISNNRFFEFPIQILKFHKKRKTLWNRKPKCTCEIYLSKKHQTFDPEKESENKSIRLNLKIKGNYTYDSEVECLKCNSKFYVSERSYHYTWWKWIKMNHLVKVNSCGNKDIDKEVNFLVSSINSVLKQEPKNLTDLKYHKERLVAFRMKLAYNKATELLESKYNWNKVFDSIETEIKTKHNNV